MMSRRADRKATKREMIELTTVYYQSNYVGAVEYEVKK